MRKLVITVEVRDETSNLPKTKSGRTVTGFTFREKFNEVDDEFMERECRRKFEDFQAITNNNDKIDIDVRELNTISNSYQLLYSFYGKENRFVKH